MGDLEIRNKQRLRKKNLQQIILASVQTAGFLSVALLAPNALRALKKLGLMPKPRQKEYISSSTSKLKRRGLLKFENGYYCLTSAGEKALRQLEIYNFKLEKPKKWDRKWRVIIFDIPEKKKKIRERVTYFFCSVGLRRLQDSVWVYPYDCEDVIGLLKTEWGIGRDVLYIIADQIENDRDLRSSFGLG